MNNSRNPHRSGNHQNALLFAVVAAQAAALLWIGSNGGAAGLLARLAPKAPHVISREDWDRIVARDPKLGSRLPALELEDTDGRRLTLAAAGKPGGLLFINACTRCVADDIRAWNQIQKAHPQGQYRVITNIREGDEVNAYKRNHQIDIVFIQENAPLTEASNPYFRPRFYLYDREGRWTYVQPPTISSDGALKQIRALLTDSLPSRKR